MSPEQSSPKIVAVLKKKDFKNGILVIIVEFLGELDTIESF